jgi:arylformamidase
MKGGWIDVTIPLRNGMPEWPGDKPFERTLTHTIAGGAGNNLSQFSCSAHIGTHMDAPLHFLPDAPSMDALAIEAVVGRARVIRIRDAEAVCPEELEAHALQPGDRVLFRTRNSERRLAEREFATDFVYVSPDAARYLVERGVRTVGVDYLSVGAFREESGRETHRVLLAAGIWIIEGLNLADVEPGEYELICLPLRLAGSDGAPARAVLRRAEQVP